MRRVKRMARLTRIRRAFVERAQRHLAGALVEERKREQEHAAAGETLRRAGQVDTTWPAMVWKMRELTLIRASERLRTTAESYAGAAAETRARREKLLDAVHRRDAFQRLHDRLARVAAQQEQTRQQQQEDEMYRLVSPRVRRPDTAPEES